MAKVKLSALVADVRGLVGGNIFSRNKGGNYVKTYTKPNNPQTSSQQANRGLFGTLMSNFRALDEVNKNSWVKNAVNYPQTNAVGDTVFLSGAQMFAKCNMVLMNAGLPQIDALPPAPVDLTTVNAPQVAATSNPFTWDSSAPATWTANVYIQVTGTLVPEHLIQVYASNQVSNGITASSSAPRQLIGSYPLSAFTQVGATNRYFIDIGTDLDAKFGLGPSVYHNDTSLFVSTGIFSETEGVVISAGIQRYTVEDTAP